MIAYCVSYCVNKRDFNSMWKFGQDGIQGLLLDSLAMYKFIVSSEETKHIKTLWRTMYYDAR